jgi:agmatinase
MPTFDPSAPALPGSGLYGLPHTPEEAAVVVLPVPFEATTSYGGGTAEGPQAVLEASRQVDLFDRELGRPYEAGIALVAPSAEVRAWNDRAKALAAPIIASGGALADPTARADLEEINRLCAQMNDWVYQQARHWLTLGKRVCTLGGDHSVPFGAIQAHAERFPGLGVLHLDAHADLRVAYEGFTWSHASIMYNVVSRLPQVAKLVQVGIRDFSEDEHAWAEGSGGRVVTHYDADLTQRRFDGVPWNRQVDQIVAALPPQVYLSFDIDGLDPTLCPHTGTPVPGGLTFAEAVALVAGVVRSGRRIVGLDLTEVAPDPGGGEWDANVGARLLYKMIGWALRSGG